MDNQIGQREYADVRKAIQQPKKTFDDIGPIIGLDTGIPAQPAEAPNNVENGLCACFSWCEEIERELSNLADRLSPALSPDCPRPVDPGPKEVAKGMSAVASKLNSLSLRLKEHARRIVALRHLIDL